MDVIVEFNKAAFRHSVSKVEIMYNPIDDDTIAVFHAMRLRNSFIRMIGL